MKIPSFGGQSHPGSGDWKHKEILERLQGLADTHLQLDARLNEMKKLLDDQNRLIEEVSKSKREFEQIREALAVYQSDAKVLLDNFRSERQALEERIRQVEGEAAKGVQQAIQEIITREELPIATLVSDWAKKTLEQVSSATQLDLLQQMKIAFPHEERWIAKDTPEFGAKECDIFVVTNHSQEEEAYHQIIVANVANGCRYFYCVAPGSEASFRQLFALWHLPPTGIMIKAHDQFDTWPVRNCVMIVPRDPRQARMVLKTLEIATEIRGKTTKAVFKLGGVQSEEAADLIYSFFAKDLQAVPLAAVDLGMT